MDLTLLNQADIGMIAEAKELQSGHSSSAYKVESDRGTYIALKLKGRKISKDYRQAYAILTALKDADYDFAPKPVFLSENYDLLLMTYVTGKPLDSIKPAKHHFLALIDAIVALRQINTQYYISSCQDLDITPNIETIQQIVQKYVVDRHKEALRHQPDPDITPWLSEIVNAYQSVASSLPEWSDEFLSHGDISEGNIITTSSDRIMLIDWEWAKIERSPTGWDDYSLGYILNHCPGAKHYQSSLIEYLTERTAVSVSDLHSAIQKRQELVSIGDIVWAHSMHSLTSAGKTPGNPEHYLNMTKHRIEQYRKVTAKGSLIL